MNALQRLEQEFAFAKRQNDAPFIIPDPLRWRANVKSGERQAERHHFFRDKGKRLRPDRGQKNHIDPDLDQQTAKIGVIIGGNIAHRLPHQAGIGLQGEGAEQHQPRRRATAPDRRGEAANDARALGDVQVTENPKRKVRREDRRDRLYAREMGEKMRADDDVPERREHPAHQVRRGARKTQNPIRPRQQRPHRAAPRLDRKSTRRRRSDIRVARQTARADRGAGQMAEAIALIEQIDRGAKQKEIMDHDFEREPAQGKQRIDAGGEAQGLLPMAEIVDHQPPPPHAGKQGLEVVPDGTGVEMRNSGRAEMQRDLVTLRAGHDDHVRNPLREQAGGHIFPGDFRAAAEVMIDDDICGAGALGSEQKRGHAAHRGERVKREKIHDPVVIGGEALVDAPEAVRHQGLFLLGQIDAAMFVIDEKISDMDVAIAARLGAQTPIILLAIASPERGLVKPTGFFDGMAIHAHAKADARGDRDIGVLGHNAAEHAIDPIDAKPEIKGVILANLGKAAHRAGIGERGGAGDAGVGENRPHQSFQPVIRQDDIGVERHQMSGRSVFDALAHGADIAIIDRNAHQDDMTMSGGEGTEIGADGAIGVAVVDEQEMMRRTSMREEGLKERRQILRATIDGHHDDDRLGQQRRRRGNAGAHHRQCRAEAFFRDEATPQVLIENRAEKIQFRRVDVAFNVSPLTARLVPEKRCERHGDLLAIRECHLQT